MKQCDFSSEFSKHDGDANRHMVACAAQCLTCGTLPPKKEDDGIAASGLVPFLGYRMTTSASARTIIVLFSSPNEQLASKRATTA